MKRTLGAVLAALALVTAACGDDDEAGAASDTTATAPSGTEAPNATEPTVAGSTTPQTAPDTAATETSFPVTIEHRFGSTTFDAPPERVITLGLQWTDVLLALGEEPVAHIAEEPAGEGGIFPWQAGLLDGSTGLTAQTVEEIPYEQIAALQPDLILVTYLAEDQTVYDRLNEIAPTIGALGDRQVDLWQDMIDVAGQIFAKPDAAAAAVAEVDELMAATVAEYPGLEGKTFAMANFVPGDQIYVVADPEDGSSVFFQQLGMVLDPDVLAAADGVTGRAEFSLEQVGLLDGDLLVSFLNGQDPSDVVGYGELPVVQAGASAELNYADVVALNTPTPLSIPYVLEVIRPQLEVAAGGAS